MFCLLAWWQLVNMLLMATTACVRVSFQSLRMRYVVLRLVASKVRNVRKLQGKM